ncbi:uncharacterized protein LOC123307365 [Coccinella septempunctata]|uniref:uncharacterized protein LOC123307365 n=1 Tax=Coccinella septempunctata TaxID=41139 RepID=UPI001D091CC4|nr:uncharacterized protein LOC123307365 [Coccinella septempunctata]
MDFIDANRPLNRPIVKFLREQQCGFYKGEPKVCCGHIPEGLKMLISMNKNNMNNLSVRDERSIRSVSRGRRVPDRKKVYTDHSLPPVDKLLRYRRTGEEENDHIELR